MQKLSFLLFCFFLGFFTNFSVLYSNPNIDALIYSGLDDIYNLKFDQAKDKFKSAQNTAPNDIKGYFYESLIHFYSAISNRDENEFNEFIRKSDEVVSKCEEILDKDENNIEALYYKGQSHSYQSLLMLSLNKSLMTAAWNGNDGYRLLSYVREKDPAYYDAYMGLGLYKIAIGFVPEKFKWLLSIIGFDGDISDGKKLLRTSEANGKFTQIESKLYLSLFSLRELEEDKGDAEKLLSELTSKYPESPLFKMFYANVLQQTGKPDLAIENALNALELNNYSLQNEVLKGANYVLGMSYFRKNDFINAAKFLEEHMKFVHKEDRYNISVFHAGIANELLGNREKALSFYEKARTDFNEERDGEAEKLFYQYSRKLISKPINEFDSLVLTAMNYRYSSMPDEALKILNNILISDGMSSLSDDDKIRLYMETGHSYTYAGKDDLAIDYFTRCTKLKPDTEKWMVPHAYFELGKIYSRKGNIPKSEDMFEKIDDFGDYELKSFLEIRLKSYRENN
jgi:tetratricopeptide (TPR) repeat protein